MADEEIKYLNQDGLTTAFGYVKGALNDKADKSSLEKKENIKEITLYSDGWNAPKIYFTSLPSTITTTYSLSLTTYSSEIVPICWIKYSEWSGYYGLSATVTCNGISKTGIFIEANYRYIDGIRYEMGILTNADFTECDITNISYYSSYNNFYYVPPVKDEITDTILKAIRYDGDYNKESNYPANSLLMFNSGKIYSTDKNALAYNLSGSSYESKEAAEGGTDLSLVTTGEKDIWNNKTSNTGTVTSVGISMNGASKGTITESGTIDLGTVITEHQDISGKLDVASIDITDTTTTILSLVQGIGAKKIHCARWICKNTGGNANISDKPTNTAFACEAICCRYSSATDYRYVVYCWVTGAQLPYIANVEEDTTAISWSRNPEGYLTSHQDISGKLNVSNPSFSGIMYDLNLTDIDNKQVLNGTGSKIYVGNSEATTILQGSSTAVNVADIALTSDIPTNNNQLTNGAGYTTNTGTVTSVAVKMNDTTKGTVTKSGTIDLGTVITEHQDISGKLDVAGIDVTGLTTTILSLVQGIGANGIHYARWICKTTGGSADISDKPESSAFSCEAICCRWVRNTDYRYVVYYWTTGSKLPYIANVEEDTTAITWNRNPEGYITSSGSCASATKATQDGDGNTITSTYYKASNPSGYTTNTGTVTSVAVKMNGSTKGTVTTSGTINLGTVLTEHQDISGKLNLSGGTMTGALNFANNTWNHLGNDIYFGDHNVDSCFCIYTGTKVIGLAFVGNSSATWKIVSNGGQSMEIFSSAEDSYGFTCGVYDNLWTLRPRVDKYMYLGSPNKRYTAVYSETATINTSDRNSKYNIVPVDDKYLALFDDLKPSTFIFKDGTSGRTHAGFISQDVEETLSKVGLTPQEFAGFCKDEKTEPVYGENGESLGSAPIKDEDGNPEYIYSLRYEEFIALNTAAIQRERDKRIELEKRVAELEDLVAKLVNSIGQ